MSQEEKPGMAAERVQGKVKAAVVKNDSKSCNLIVASCYEQTPKKMLSHSIEEITGIEYEMKAYSQSLKKAINFKFLCFNLSHDCNFDMNDNDVGDELWLVYCFMKFQQNIEWWGSLWLWGMVVSFVNVYMMIAAISNLFNYLIVVIGSLTVVFIHCSYHKLQGLPMKYDHYKLQEACGAAYIEPNTKWSMQTKKVVAQSKHSLTAPTKKFPPRKRRD